MAPEVDVDDFFKQMAPWRRSSGALHLYVLPHESDLDRFARLQARMRGIEQLPLMPRPYLHCTLQRLAQFDDEVSQQQLSGLGATLTATLEAVPAFTLDFGPPQVFARQVACDAAPHPAWDALLRDVRAALGLALGDEPGLPEPPACPHLTLAYATGAVRDDVVLQALGDAPAVGPVLVDAVHLVSVTVRPEVGVFDFTHLANWDLT